MSLSALTWRITSEGKIVHGRVFVRGRVSPPGAPSFGNNFERTRKGKGSEQAGKARREGRVGDGPDGRELGMGKFTLILRYDHICM